MSNINKKDILRRVEQLEGALSFIMNTIHHHGQNISAIVQILDNNNLLPPEPKATETPKEKEEGKDVIKEEKEEK